jgi:hypothetical protein
MTTNLSHDPSATAVAQSRPRKALNAVSLILAALLLVASVVVGFWLIDTAPKQAGTAKAKELTSKSEMSIYGGDAYTGIQNAAAETERSVVESANTLAALESAQHSKQAAADAERWGHLWKALAALVIAVGAANFTIALQRFAATRAQLV